MELASVIAWARPARPWHPAAQIASRMALALGLGVVAFGVAFAVGGVAEGPASNAPQRYGPRVGAARPAVKRSGAIPAVPSLGSRPAPLPAQQPVRRQARASSSAAARHAGRGRARAASAGRARHPASPRHASSARVSGSSVANSAAATTPARTAPPSSAPRRSSVVEVRSSAPAPPAPAARHETGTGVSSGQAGGAGPRGTSAGRG